MDRLRQHPGDREPLPREPVQVDAPVARARRREGRLGLGVARDEGIAHFRADFPEPGDLPGSFYTRVRGTPDGDLAVEPIPVAFTRVRPGESLV